MSARIRPLAIVLIAGLLGTGLSACGSINEKVSAGMGNHIPQWAGGMPDDVPPRPGTAQYDAWMKERERRRLTPAADREKEQPAPPMANGPADAAR